MLLKFTTADMLNTVLIDVSTNRPVYNIVTVVSPSPVDSEPDGKDITSFSSSQRSKPKEHRHTHITDSSGSILASVVWHGRRPDITILHEKVGGLSDLFGSTTVRFMPKNLAIPTRFDAEYIWTATPDSLTLFDYDSETIKATFYQNVVRLPGYFNYSRKSKILTPSISLSQPCPSTDPSYPSSSSTSSLQSSISSNAPSTSPSSLSLCSLPVHTDTPKSAFIPTHLPGLGSNYLEFCPHPLAHDIEIIISFLMMEILRRGRFLLTPYTFEKPKMWQLSETRDLILRQLRRNTI